MFSFIKNNSLKILDDKIDIYLVYLVHIQQSITITINEKIDAFERSEYIGNEIHAITSKIITKEINKFNEQDFEVFIDNNLSTLIKAINKEIEKYNSRICLDLNVVFSIKEIIEKLTESKDNTVFLTKDKIDRLLSYKRLYKNKKDEETENKLNNDIDTLKKKMEDDFEDIRFKTFTSLIRGVNNKNVAYLYKTNKYIIQNYLLKSFEFISDYTDETKGMFFIQSKKYDIGLVIDEDTIRIEYFIRFNKIDDMTKLIIIGFIKHIDAKVDFYLDETYTNEMMDSVLNTFNLIPIIQKYNDSYVDFFHKTVKEENSEDLSKKEIDDFFAGKII